MALDATERERDVGLGRRVQVPFGGGLLKRPHGLLKADTMSRVLRGFQHRPCGIVRQRLQLPFFHEAAEASRDAKLAFEDTLDALGLMDRNIQRAHKLIENFKKLSVSQISDTLEPLNLLDVIDEIVQLFGVNARKAGLTVEVKSDLPDRAAAAWTGYRGFMSQVLLNLFTNAERYAYAGGGGRIEITVGSTSEKSGESRFVVQVRDFGRGMPQDIVARVFEPFFTTGRSVGGSGLGLSIVKNLVTNSLKGTIDVQSAPEQGTTFTLVLPRTTE